ncbi:uncharacterized protein LACBIDRAFT_303972 [Laccaria bicolor S238N-H82]|uniref:Predicted protein n=1 Tax=Laccaria bicolor (strain S238N-H82 / ATCC MYA-4686) TaxID=486041 RepID=B0DKN6_LACBS|nr:uncharacterized protein LACBIDRAFT_303972 [Laccaria bicolor S238N-H82]EDR04773.1 predicted protein [Laccaria bicolor S238N-H82]|eukprot:XP_001884597.1 predicted protein [Laccaria bicolor S238N-H82]
MPNRTSLPQTNKSYLITGICQCELPVELIFEVLSHLPLKNLAVFPVVCREWLEFIKENESTIYHNAAQFHNFVPASSSSQRLHEALKELYSQRSLQGVNSWKELCQRRLQIQQSWLGNAPSRIVRHHTSPNRRVHRIKVDELAGFIITTSQSGGLAVTDINTDQLLWSLPETYVRAYAHCEYSNGYIIFDRFTSEKEIWRLSSIDSVSADSSSSLPDTIQTQIPPDGSHPGLFKPHALLQTPEPTRAYRFVYPTLLVAAFERVYLYDVPSARLVQIIENIQPLTTNISLGTLNYVDLSARHVFLCGGHALRVFDRGTGRAVLTLPSNKFVYGRWGYRLETGPRNESAMGSVLVEHEMEAIMCGPGTELNQYFDEFVAVHVSPCGSHLVGLLSSSRLIIMPHFERAIHNQMDIFDLTLDVQLGSPHAQSVYLAYENNRVAVVTGTALFIVHLPPFAPSSNFPATPPPIRVFRVFSFLNPERLGSASCLQMSDTGIYLNCKPSFGDDADDDDDDEDDDELDPEMLEDAFWDSIADQATYAVLPNGDYMVITDDHGVGHTMRSSDVYSVDFVERYYS